jgi:hypothetical protein
MSEVSTGRGAAGELNYLISAGPDPGLKNRNLEEFFEASCVPRNVTTDTTLSNSHDHDAQKNDHSFLTAEKEEEEEPVNEKGFLGRAKDKMASIGVNV